MNKTIYKCVSDLLNSIKCPLVDLDIAAEVDTFLPDLSDKDFEFACDLVKEVYLNTDYCPLNLLVSALKDLTSTISITKINFDMLLKKFEELNSN